MSALTDITGRVSSATGRGSQGGRGRGGGRNGGHGQQGGRGGTHRPPRIIFKGDTEGMNGNVFQCFEEQTDCRQFAKTWEALGAYVAKSIKQNDDLAPLFEEDMRTPVLDKPEKIADNADEVDKAIWQLELNDFVKRKRAFQSNLAAVKAIIIGQCSEAMQDKLKAIDSFKEKMKHNDCHWLLTKIRSITLQFDERKSGFISLMNAERSFLNCVQLPGQSLAAYRATLRSWAVTITQQGGNIAGNYKLIPEHDEKGNIRPEALRRTMAYGKTFAIALITGADSSKFNTLIAHLSNQYAMGKDEYPTDEIAAYNLLVHYVTPENIQNRASAQVHPPRTKVFSTPATGSTTTASTVMSSEMTFVQNEAIVPDIRGRVFSNIRCRHCTQLGHYRDECPALHAVNGANPTQLAVMMAQANASLIDPQWILLDSQSTISVFNNPTMLRNIRPSTHTLRALTNGGHQDSNMVGDFHNLGEVWYNADSIANILSLADVRKVCRVTLDTSDEPALCVHRSDGTVMKFAEHASGLYVYDASKLSDPITAYTLISTVADQKKLFSRRQIDAADLARDLYRKLGRPSEAEFYSILTRNLIRNCPVTPDDARRAVHIYGPDVAVLKGKMTRSAAAPRAPTFEAVPLPAPVTTHHRNVTLCADFFFVQGLGFLHTISRGIGFRTIMPVSDRTHKTMLVGINAALNLYRSRGLNVCDIHADNEFDCLREDIRPIAMNIVPADSHVGEVERSIRTIKERLRSCVHGLPFRRLPKIMITHMVADSVRCLNQFPHANGISATLSPSTIVTGSATPDYNAMRLELGTYVQVFEDHDPTNTPRGRSLGAIALCPTGNAQGDYHFMSLATGARISRHTWTMLPIPDTAIARVEALAKDEGRPLIQDHGFVVEWRPDHPIDDSEYDRDYVPPADGPIDVFAATDYEPIDPTELAHLDSVAPADVPYDDPFSPPDQGAHEDALNQPINNIGSYLDGANSDITDDDTANAASDADANNLPAAFDTEPPMEEEDQGAPLEAEDQGEPLVEDQGAPGANNEAQAAPGPAYNLRPRAPTNLNFNAAMDAPHDGKSYYPPTQFLQEAQGCVDLGDEQRYAFNFILTKLATTCTQMSERAGLRKHGKTAEAALMTEFSQLEDLDVYDALDPATLTRAQKKSALRAINVFKEKRCGKLKGRTCADGRSQRNMYDKSQTASPTIATNALMLSIIIDAFEDRDVATADVAGAYLKAFMDDFVIMKFVGPSVRILCKLNPTHERCVTTENGVEVLYVRLIKALYGCVKSALLWYELFTNNLKEMGFELNPYDPCVANCMIDGKQCTIAWYVDDTKISHIDPNVVTNIIRQLETRFDKMSVTRGREHVFLGMHIRYTDEHTAVIMMKTYLEEAILESGLDISRTASNPANKNLFEVDETSAPLGKNDSEMFHSVSAKLLYVSLRARVDLLLAIAFLCTRVSKSTQQDLSKLKRVLEYIKGSMDQEYVIGADDLGHIRTWVDASYAVHPDMRSHTGGAISLGRGGILCKSTKQKLNTKSSTEAEFVGASDYLPNTIWVKNFLEAQGYIIDSNILEQDNESAMRLEKNGRMSAGPQSRHISIRYFWMKDRINTEGITIRHCPTLQMVADFFTKPLQGNLFRKFRDVIMGTHHMDTLALDLPLPLEERVGDTNRPGTGTSDYPSNHASDSTVKTVATVKKASVSWADVARGTSHRASNERAVCNQLAPNRMFRDTILTKQSSI